MTSDKIGKIPHSVPMNLEKLVEYSPHSIVSREIAKNNSGTVTMFAFDSGQGLSEHTAPFDAIVQIIDGQAEIIIDGKKVVAESGTTVVMPANVPHAVNAKQRFKMQLIMLKEKVQ